MNLIQSYSFSLQYDIVLATSGSLTEGNKQLVAYTTIGSILIFQNNQQKFINIKREFKSLEISQSCLIMASQNTLTVHDVENNFEQCYLEIPDGINTITLGQYYDGKTLQNLIFVGGNCSLQGYNNLGEEIYWNVASDEIICLHVFGFEKEQYIIVGTADNIVRVFKCEEIVFQFTTQSLSVSFSGIIYFDQTHIVAAQENGELQMYRSQLQMWNIKDDKESIIKTIIIDENYFVVGRKNGIIELRQLMNGILLQKINIDESITSIIYDDLRGVGVNQIVAITKTGQVKGYTLVEKEDNQQNLQNQYQELLSKKQELNQLLQLDTMPANLKVFHGYSQDLNNKCVNLVFIIKEQGYYITQAIIFNDTFYNDGYIINSSQPSDKLYVSLKELNESQKIVLKCRVLVTQNPYGNFTQVLETTVSFPKFGNFQYTAQDLEIESWAEANIKERIPRYVKWIDQCFIIQEDVKKQFESTTEFKFNSINIITQEKLQIIFNQNEGKVKIKCDSITICGDIIQDLCDFIQIQELMSIGYFPKQMNEFKQILNQVELHRQSKMQISGDVAESINQVKSFIVKAEDSRMIGDVVTMKKMYANVMVQNKAIQNEIYKKTQNNEALMNSLKEVNAMINKASQLRVGNAKTNITNLCRNAIKKNNLHSLIEIIQQGKDI